MGVVLATAAIMGYRVLARKKAACGAGCGCDSLKPKAGAALKRDSTKPLGTP